MPIDIAFKEEPTDLVKFMESIDFKRPTDGGGNHYMGPNGFAYYGEGTQKMGVVRFFYSPSPRENFDERWRGIDTGPIVAEGILDSMFPLEEQANMIIMEIAAQRLEHQYGAISRYYDTEQTLPK